MINEIINNEDEPSDPSEEEGKETLDRQMKSNPKNEFCNLIKYIHVYILNCI